MTAVKPEDLIPADYLLYLVGAVHHAVSLCEGQLIQSGQAIIFRRATLAPDDIESVTLRDLPDIVREMAPSDEIKDALLGLLASAEMTVGRAHALLARRWLEVDGDPIPSGADKPVVWWASQ